MSDRRATVATFDFRRLFFKFPEIPAPLSISSRACARIGLVIHARVIASNNSPARFFAP